MKMGEDEGKSTFLEIVRGVGSLVSVGALFVVLFGVRLDVTAENVALFSVLILVVVGVVAYAAWKGFRALVNRIAAKRVFWGALMCLVAVLGAWRVSGAYHDVVDARNDLWDELVSARKTQSAQEVVISDLRETIVAQSVVRSGAGTGPSEAERTPEREPLVFAENFDTESLDRNKWSAYCKYGEYYLSGGQLHIKVVGDEASETCALRPELAEAVVVTRVAFTVTVESESNSYGWIGLFANCGEKYLNVTASRDRVGVALALSGFVEIEAFNSVPVTRRIELEKVDGVVRIRSSDLAGGSIYSEETECYTEITNIRLGSDRSVGSNGEVVGTIDDLEVWGAGTDG